MKRLILVFFLLIFVVGCTLKKTPGGILENEKMIAVLTDIHLVDSYLGTSRYDTTTQPASNYKKAVYKKYGIDSVQFQKSLRYYSRRPELLDTMYYQVLQKLDRMERYEVLKEQSKAKAKELLEIEKQNATIRLKPQPNWFFKYDTAGLFNKRSRPVPISADIL